MQWLTRLANDLRGAGHAGWVDEAEINIGDLLIEKNLRGPRPSRFRRIGDTTIVTKTERI